MNWRDRVKMHISRKLSLLGAIVLASIGLLSGVGDVSAAAVVKQLASGGVAQTSVVVSSGATARVLVAAQELAAMLGRMTGGTFPVVVGDGTTGLAVGTVTDFPQIECGILSDPDDPLQRECYRLRTHAEGAWLIGSAESGVEHAVWDFLGRLGYRLFFLTDHWEIVPDLPNAAIALDETERPDFHTRLAPRGAPWSDTALWTRWRKRNRITAAFSLSTGHSYGNIIRRNPAEFAQHPEYYALRNGVRAVEGSKFCISNPGLRALVTDYSVETMQNNPALDSISLEPSDGGGWCECAECAAMGSVSDRVLMLANESAEAINALGLGPRFVGIYAYNEHSPPPHIAGHSNVIVSIATSFIRGGYTIEQLVEGWQAAGVTTGIREYHDVFAWSDDQPRKARGGSLAYLQRTIPYFYEQNARFMNSECSDSWGANGLGYWLSPLLLWDVTNAERIDELVDDFLTKAFGAAEAPMRDFYHFLQWDRTLQTTDNVIARMYALLAQAYTLTADFGVRQRLDDLVLYTRYVQLYNEYRQATGAARQAGFEAVLRHVWRMRERVMQSTTAIYHRDQFRDDSVSVPPEAVWAVPEEDNPWKDSTPYTEAEIAALIADGLANYQEDVRDFDLVQFSANLVPCQPLGPPALPAGTATLSDRGSRRYWTWLKTPGSFDLEVTGGLIAHYRDRGNVKITLSAWYDGMFVPVAYDESVPPDGKTYTVTLASPYAGQHLLEVADGSDQTRIVQPQGLPITYYSTFDDAEAIPGTWTLYVYVPKGTPVVGGFASSTTGRLRDGKGTILYDFTQQERPGYFSVPVPAGQDGAFWKLESCKGHRIMMTIPPCLAKTPAELLLPQEVVDPFFEYPKFGDVTSMVASEVTHHSASLHASLDAEGSSPCEVILFWGPRAGDWIGQVSLGTVGVGAFSYVVTGLAPATAYTFQALAFNAQGQTWSAPAEFSTPSELPFVETFETRIYGPLHRQNAWIADPTDAAEVQSETTSGGGSARACSLRGGTLTQRFNSIPDESQIVWGDFRVRPQRSEVNGRVEDIAFRSIDEDAGETAIFYVDYVTGFVIVLDGKNPVALINHPSIPLGAWARFTVRSDYATRTWDLWLNGTNIARNLDFYNQEQDHFAELIFVEQLGASRVSAFDDIQITQGWLGRPLGVSFLDDDGDGICDDWERYHFGSVAVASGGKTDYDQDGFSDRDEFLAGTDALDPQSRLVISELNHLGGARFELCWQSVQGRTYTLLHKTNLTQKVWVPVVAGLLGDPPQNRWVIASETSPAFYRVRVDPLD